MPNITFKVRVCVIPTCTKRQPKQWTIDIGYLLGAPLSLSLSLLIHIFFIFGTLIFLFGLLFKAIYSF